MIRLDRETGQQLERQYRGNWSSWREKMEKNCKN